MIGHNLMNALGLTRTCLLNQECLPDFRSAQKVETITTPLENKFLNMMRNNNQICL